jgi:hypothetical protein
MKQDSYYALTTLVGKMQGFHERQKVGSVYFIKPDSRRTPGADMTKLNVGRLTKLLIVREYRFRSSKDLKEIAKQSSGFRDGR